jgi:hypothetical protein
MHEPQQQAGFEQQQARTSKSTVSFGQQQQQACFRPLLLWADVVPLDRTPPPPSPCCKKPAERNFRE